MPLAFLSAFLLLPARAAQPPRYLKLSQPRTLVWDRQAWEGPQSVHTLSVVEAGRDGWKYWGYYGLNGGMGLGLARSNDLLHWTKYEQNPILYQARWASALSEVDRDHPEAVYLALERFQWRQGPSPMMFGAQPRRRGAPFLPPTLSTYIVLARAEDGIRFTISKILVPPREGEKNQNPNLFRDPVSGRYFLTWYRGDNDKRFEIVSRAAARLEDLDDAPEKVLLRSSDTLAAPSLLYAPPEGRGAGRYYLATEIFPGRFSARKEGWQTKVFASDAPDGAFTPVAENPVLTGDRACLFQHVLGGRFYGFDCHIARRDPADANKDVWVVEKTEAPLP